MVMKSFLALVACATSVLGHYNFPSMIYGTTTTPAWTYVRPWTNDYAYTPVQNVSSLDIRCNVNGSTSYVPNTLSVKAGSLLAFTASPDLYHPGVAFAYMAKVPAGKTAATWDGSGAAWFKVYELGPTFSTNEINWPTLNALNINFTVPAAVPNGDYLVRVEHIALHVANTEYGAQFYLSCGQVTVTNGGSGTPNPLVSFPGAYGQTDPGILINIYAYPVPTSYTYPGPAVWTV